MTMPIFAPERRDSIVWTLLFFAAIGSYAASHAHIVPPAYVETVKDWAALAGFVAAWLKASPLGPGKVRDMEEPGP